MGSKGSTDSTPDDKKRLTFLKAYTESRSVTRAAEIAGVHRSTVYVWRREPNFRDQMEAAFDVRVDEVEDKLYERAMGGDTTALIFFLKSYRPERFGDKLRHEERAKIKAEAEQIVRDQFYSEMRGLPANLRKALMSAIDANAA